MSWIEIIADRKIRDAQEEGAFDNLPGKGKPLKLGYDPNVPPELRAAYRLMKEAQILPDWIQLDKEVRTFQQQLQARLEEYAARRAGEVQRLRASGQKGAAARAAEERLDRARDAALLAQAEGLRELNRRIDRLNLIVPAASRQRPRLDIRERVSELEARFPRLHPRTGAVPWAALLQEEKPAVRMGNRMPLRRKRGPIG